MPFSGLPYWRLSGFYLFYFATLGILVPYWGLYLQWEGFSARQIGELTAILLATRIIAPNVWGWIADHRGQRLQIVRLASLLSIVAFLRHIYFTKLLLDCRCINGLQFFLECFASPI